MYNDTDLYAAIARVFRLLVIIRDAEPHSIDSLLHTMESAQSQVPDSTLCELEFAAYLAGVLKYGGG